MDIVFLQDPHDLLLLMSTLILSTAVDALQVIGGNITVVQGGTVILPCKLVDTKETLSQISWQRMTRGNPRNDNFFTILSTNGPQFVNGEDNRFKFVGSFKDADGSLQLSNVKLKDEGTYTCIFTLFPSGNHKTEIPLNLLVPPVTSLKDNHLTLGTEEVPLITCTAPGSKPPAEVRWLTGTLGENVRATTTSTQHANGTTTTASSLFGIPTKEINHHSIQCVVTSAALEKEETLPFTIQVYFPPMEVNIYERSKDSFECVADSNPTSNFTWRRTDHPKLPSAVRGEGATLQFLSMTSYLNGLYQCEASNPYGKKHGDLFMHVTSEVCNACWTLFGFSLFLTAGAVAVAVYYFYKSRSRQPVPTTSSSPNEGGEVELHLEAST